MVIFYIRAKHTPVCVRQLYWKMFNAVGYQAMYSTALIHRKELCAVDLDREDGIYK